MITGSQEKNEGTLNLKVIEQIIKNRQAAPQLKVLEKQYATPVRVFQQIIDADEFEAYGVNSHTFSQDYQEINVLLGGGDAFQGSLFTTSGFETLLMYTSSNLPNAGDKIELDSDNNTVKRYIVDKKEQYGTEKNVFFKYSLSGIEE